MKKITLVGDITCDKPLLHAAKTDSFGYQWGRLFFYVKEKFKSSDLLIGNLETVFSGGTQFNQKPFAYNSPDSFLDEIANCSFDILSLANNHCMDEGLRGLFRTQSEIELRGMTTTGAGSQDKRYAVAKLGSVRVAIVAYAHAINVHKDSQSIKDIDRYVNLLYPFDIKAPETLKQKIIHLLPLGLRETIKRRLHMPTVTKVTDSMLPEMQEKEHLERLKRDISEARREADIVILFAHFGGQFNEEPGEYSQFITKYMVDCGADLVVGHHPHIIQGTSFYRNVPIVYSLGGFSLSPSAEYIHDGCLAEYSLALNLYLNEQEKRIDRITFSMFKGVEEKTGKLVIYPLETLNIDDQTVHDKEELLNRLLHVNKEPTEEHEYQMIDIHE